MTKIESIIDISSGIGRGRLEVCKGIRPPACGPGCASIRRHFYRSIAAEA